MTAPVAAAYMCVSQSTFLVRFASIGRKEGGNTFWARAQLDQIIAEQFDLTSIGAPPPELTSEDEYAAWKAKRNSARQK
ncbi:hypothetical protein Sj15T_01830 [Sphingobium sp. TA15]|uniref:DNA-binding protein n=2 Tax=Sphingobium TaxID=165695 RepID=D4YZR3_SPHIU|nr:MULTISPECIES: hypothetical protein [Sphingobium]BAI95845.1 hypothetical protein SJA_C1-10110 [Sphingobium indicum UT26S]BDD65162.1 hypothetical protein Sj15T_01830 [Sphingobium sp. TA15]GAY22661.1 hypothetical protein SFOMI_3221 [Sphingobium fuliginis]